MAWLQLEGVVKTRTSLSCKREVPSSAQAVCRTLLAPEVSTGVAWLDLSRACFSQTFGIITFCGIPAALMLSASAVADSHPWRRRMRYALGVVVFAIDHRHYSCPHPSAADVCHPPDPSLERLNALSSHSTSMSPDVDVLKILQPQGSQGQRHRMCDHT